MNKTKNQRFSACSPLISNKRGLSGIVLAVIMVGLVLVAVGIVWVVVSGILTTQTEALDYDQKCLGLTFDVTIENCDGSNCDVTVERATASKGDPIDGMEITLAEGTASANETLARDVVKDTVEITTTMTDPTANVRIYFTKEDDSKHYCSTIFSSE